MNDRIARAALTRLFEPNDTLGRALVDWLGADAALRFATGSDRAHAVPGFTDDEVSAALKRWAPRVPELDPEKDLGTIERLGGGFLVPEDDHWPIGLGDLPDVPLGLWYRGEIGKGIKVPFACAALTGSRDCTGYGAAVTSDLAYSLAHRGITVIAGLGYGIDSQAHRGALAGYQGNGHATIAVLAGGLDRDYPSGNADLAAAIRSNGLTLSELPPGSAPTRHRFLQRNRIIAALAGVTCVVEARWRSGALNTAHHAKTIGRKVAAVPGSVHSANSAGCHRLLKEGGAALVTDATDLSELLTKSWSVGREPNHNAYHHEEFQRDQAASRAATVGRPELADVLSHFGLEWEPEATFTPELLSTLDDWRQLREAIKATQALEDIKALQRRQAEELERAIHSRPC